MMTFGNIVPLNIGVRPECLSSLVALASSHRRIREFADVTRDDRLTAGAWERVVRDELLELLSWTLRREKARLTTDVTTLPDLPFRTTLCLLPGYGVSLHILRRAVGFASLGIRTVCGLPARARGQENLVRRIAARLSLENELVELDCDCASAGLLLDGETTLVVITGRAESVRAVRTSSTWHRVLGSAGSCAVVVGDDEGRALTLGGNIAQTELSESCTRLRDILVAEALVPESSGRRFVDGAWKPLEQSLGQYLRNIHPSVVLATGSINETAGPRHVSGYSVLYCNEFGVPIERVGFGADPEFGWPGDYVL